MYRRMAQLMMVTTHGFCRPQWHFIGYRSHCFMTFGSKVSLRLICASKEPGRHTSNTAHTQSCMFRLAWWLAKISTVDTRSQNVTFALLSSCKTNFVMKSNMNAIFSYSLWSADVITFFQFSFSDSGVCLWEEYNWVCKFFQLASWGRLY